MAVEIPVIVDIEGAFKDAADRVNAAIKPLQREVSENALDLVIGKVSIDDDEVEVTLRKIKSEGANAFGGLEQWIEAAKNKLVELAKSGEAAKEEFTGFLEVKHYLEDMKTASETSRMAIDGLANTLKGIRANLVSANTTLENAPIGSDSWKQAAKDAAMYEQQLQELQGRIKELSAEDATVDFSRYIENAEEALAKASVHARELRAAMKGMMTEKEMALFEPDVSKYYQMVTALEQAQEALNKASDFSGYIEGLSTVNIELLQMKQYYAELEASSRKLSTSIEGYRERVAEINEQWRQLTYEQKYDSTGKMTAEAEKLYSSFVKETEEMERQAKELSEIYNIEKRRNELRAKGAQNRRYEEAILKSTVKTMRVLQEQERILSERLSVATVGSGKYATLKNQLQEVRQEIERINREVSGSNAALGVMDTKLGSLIKNSLRLVALHAGARFVSNIREVTSEFELQKVALGSIIQDTERASKLFRQIKAAAIESPFEIKDLVRDVKQLSAYRVETDKLFDVTMKLADVSAGLGVDMNRLILAYGQVRAASVLRGQELRQFTEAGIPLVELLAEKFTELNKRTVTTAEVFELISKRAVPFKMIAEIFDDMTSAGGAFYKMQEKQAETLLGQWNNLKDAISIMYDEIGRTETVHNAMSALIKDARAIMLNWRKWAQVIKAVGAGYITYLAVTKSVIIYDRLLAAAEAAATAGTTARDLAIKKLTTSLLGQRAASWLASKAMAIYAAATLNAATASNALKTALWNVVAALASNPFTIAAVAVAGLVAAFSALIKQSKTVEERTSDAGKAISSMGKARSNDELIKQYERLSDKTKKTAKEVAALRDVSRELGKAFPLATQAMDKQTGALILNIDKLKEYSTTAQNTIKDLMEGLIAENEAEIKRYERKQEHIQKVLGRGFGFVEGSFYFNLSKDTKAADILRQKLLATGDAARQLAEDNQDLRDAIAGVKKEGGGNEPYPPIPGTEKLKVLRQEISDLTNAYKKFVDLRKYMGKEAALDNIATFFPSLAGWEPTYENMIKKLEDMLEKYKGNADATRLIEQALANVQFDELKRSLEDKLKKLSDEIKRSEAARNFYKDIFDLTGDEDLATSLSVSVYGGIGSDFKERLQRQLEETLSGITIDADMRKAIDLQDFETILEKLPEGTEKVREEIIKLRDAQQKFSVDQVKGWLNDLKKEKTYSEKRIELARKTQEEIARIDETVSDPQVRYELTRKFLKKEQEDAAKLRYESFKESPLYVQMFGDLESATESTLQTMRKNITEMMEQWKELKPTELKEMQSRLQEIDEQLAKKNPFKSLAQSYKEYSDLLKSGRSRASDNALMVASNKELKSQKDALDAALENLKVKKRQYEFAKKNKSENLGLVAVAATEYAEAKRLVAELQKQVDETQEGADAAARQAAEWNLIQKKIALAQAGIEEYTALLRQLGQVIEEAMSAIVGDEAAKYAKEVTETIGLVTDALKSVAKAAMEAEAGQIADVFKDVGAGLLGIVSAGIKLYNLIASSQLKKYNDAMTEQDKILHRLDRSYDRLGRAMEKSFGNDYIYNYTEQLKVLEAEREALQKQLEIQQEKSEKASREADRNEAAEQVEEIQEKLEDLDTKVEESAGKMSEFFLGTDLTSAAEEFAESWLEAYREFGDTTGAIKQKMEDMINNLIIKSTLAGAAQKILKPFFDEIEALSDAGGLSSERVAELTRMLQSKTGELNTTLTTWANVLRASGIELRGSVGSLSGISREIATASEESILALAAGINTQNYYMSVINENVKTIVALMGGGTAAATQSYAPAAAVEEGPVMPSVQEMIYDHLPAMHTDLAAIRSMLSDVIKTNGTPATKYVATRM